ncbi:EF-hand domain-containing protein [Ruegeria pomeroyi]|uniref:EF-hand domain-containing protein n=1 Tax=Ruegeria pomeroyi TaxID=89184 RepID=A0A850LK89_9RHOB|nr:EF-hand domain-containing protein [Ruegeria pomeroyi]NVL02859.1 EF-hand domain-containing protein [Ruegeria pomeroyi]QWV11021.1 EF-hand domain-containing protein [Ruegeria pomeroyi]HCE72591.1 calcium-binding protein [Ruegeria sp.]
MMRLLLLASACALGTAALAQGAPGAHFIENWDMDGDALISAAEIVEKRGEIFVMFDQNEDGALDTAEYDLFDETRRADIEANAGGRKGPMALVDQAMDRAFNDADGDGLVSAEEFTAKSAAFFDMLDKNGDGVISSADFKPGG